MDEFSLGQLARKDLLRKLKRDNAELVKYR
jgi:hypothetical protein